MTGDEHIKKQIVEQLYWDDRVNAADIRVEVHGGRVGLSGTVPSHGAREAAELDASRVAGVRSVENRLALRFPAEISVPDDREIGQAIESKLLWDADVESDDLKVSVTGGLVALEGTVGSYWRKIKAEALAYQVSGVSYVENKLAVVPSRDIVDEAIAETIMAALGRNSLVDEGAVDLTVENGVVSLSGTVDSWNGYLAAQDAAAYTLGVVDVVNNLVVSGTEEPARRQGSTANR